ncbi:MAG: FtsQ-type POTRA domain-containing protein [Candidatus Mycalebacterium zealandia]|nr:MAG: FtsQ-type POTRA domain-containing protein [Candidatus Mycalebacterium zealandia]
MRNLKNRGKKNLRKGGAAKVFLAVVIVVAVFFVSRSALLIGNASVEGARAVSEENILRTAGLYSGEKVLLLPGAVNRALKSEPWVETVSMTRDFRGGAVIKIKEKKPFCLLAMPNGTFFYIDESGVPLGSAPAGLHGMDFPVVRAQPAFVSEALAALNLSSSAVSAPGWDDISEVVVLGESGVEIFTRPGQRIDLGADLKAHWEKLERITSNLRARGLSPKYINLRRKGVGIVSFREGVN